MTCLGSHSGLELMYNDQNMFVSQQRGLVATRGRAHVRRATCDVQRATCDVRRGITGWKSVLPFGNVQ